MGILPLSLGILSLVVIWGYLWANGGLLCLARLLLNPSACLDEHLVQFKFLGILVGVAIRTKKPLDLHLAPMVWKQLCCIPLMLEDLEEVDLLCVQTLNGILHIEDSGITQENFHEVREPPAAAPRSPG